jgi:hypothetical protein
MKPSYFTLAVHAVAVAAAIHLWLIQSPLVQPLLATKKAPPVVPPLAMLAVVAFGGCMAATQIPVIIGGGETLVNCVTAEIAKGDDTFEGIATACGATAIAEVVGIVETLATTSAPAKAVHHKVVK